MNYLSNAFSLQMLDGYPAVPIVEHVAAIDIPDDVVSCVGHADTANVLSEILGTEVACNRQSIRLTKDDILYVAQVIGGRLPDGATTLPDGVKIVFLKIRVLYNDSLCVHGGKVCDMISPCYANCSYFKF